MINIIDYVLFIFLTDGGFGLNLALGIFITTSVWILRSLKGSVNKKNLISILALGLSLVFLSCMRTEDQ